MSNQNDPQRLLILVEPTKHDLENWPFLDGLGGVMILGRHPVLVHYCNTYNAYAILRRKVAVMDDMGIGPADEERARAIRHRDEAYKQLQILKSGMGAFKMEDVGVGKTYFTDPNFHPEDVN
jgi:hypothetical protein